jgi:hypothetical protein
MYLYDAHIMRRATSWPRIGALAVTGFLIGGYGAYQVQSALDKKIDPDILNAFE